MDLESAERNRRQQISRCFLAGVALAISLVSVGCSHAPEYSIFGSFFPVWIFCAVGGLLLTAIAHVAIARTAIAGHLAAPVLFYLSMATFSTCMLWVFFYS
jgi:YtcA family